jgi:hypothetical protein
LIAPIPTAKAATKAATRIFATLAGAKPAIIIPMILVNEPALIPTVAVATTRPTQIPAIPTVVRAVMA